MDPTFHHFYSHSTRTDAPSVVYAATTFMYLRQIEGGIR